MSKINPEIFRGYDIRGIYPDELNEETAYRVAQSLIKYLRTDLDKKQRLKIALGQDMRTHSPFLAREVMRGLTDAGADVTELGRVPTPAFMYAVAYKDLDGGVMVTASHNPKQYNGLKLAREKARPIGLSTGLEKIRDYTVSWAKVEKKNEEKGQVKSFDNITDEYVQQDLSFINLGGLKPLKVAADPANAMGSLYLEPLFRRLPDAELIKINWDLNGNMPIHEPNPLKEETLQQLKAVVRNERADLGMATDGDGDRIGFVDEQGTALRGDIVTAMFAKHLLDRYPGSKIGFEVRSSKVVKEVVEENGGEPVLMPAGYAKMKPIMEKENVLFAGESSMHYMFRENYNHESPVLAVAMMLQIVSKADQPLSEIQRKFVRYHHSGEINFDVEDKEAVITKLQQQFQDGKLIDLDGVRIEYDNWWFNVRASNTEPLLRLNLEADTKELMESKLKEVKQIISGQVFL